MATLRQSSACWSQPLKRTTLLLIGVACRACQSMSLATSIPISHWHLQVNTVEQTRRSTTLNTGTLHTRCQRTIQEFHTWSWILNCGERCGEDVWLRGWELCGQTFVSSVSSLGLESAFGAVPASESIPLIYLLPCRVHDGQYQKLNDL